MSSDAERFHHFGFRADALLKSMESTFLDVLAEDQAADFDVEAPVPKECGDEPQEVVAFVAVDEHALDHLVTAFIGCKLGRDDQDRQVMLGLAVAVVRSLVDEAVKKGWYDSPLPEEGN